LSSALTRHSVLKSESEPVTFHVAELAGSQVVSDNGSMQRCVVTGVVL